MGVSLGQWFSNLTASESTGGLFKQVPGLIVPPSIGLGWVSRICTSNRFSGANHLLIPELTASEYRFTCRIARVKYRMQILTSVDNARLFSYQQCERESSDLNFCQTGRC